MLGKQIKSEFKLIVATSCFIIMVFAMVFGVALINFMGYQKLRSLNKSYNDTIELIESSEYEADAEMEAEAEEKTAREEALSVYETQIEQTLFALTPEYGLTHAMEFSILWFPVVFGIYGIYIGTVDYSSRTIKHKIARAGRKVYWSGKFASICITALSMTMIYSVFSILTGYLMTDVIVSDNVNVGFDATLIITVGNEHLKVIFMMTLAIIYSLVGFMFGVLFKNGVIGTVLIISYEFVIPVLGRYDIKNIINYVAYKLGNSYGVVVISDVTNIGGTAVIAAVLITCIVTMAISYHVIKKKSAYV